MIIGLLLNPATMIGPIGNCVQYLRVQTIQIYNIFSLLPVWALSTYLSALQQ